MPMISIAPSILSANFGRLDAEIEAVHEAGADWIHLDVMDGAFVPNLTFGAALVKRLHKRPGLTFDAHLMVMNPDSMVEEFAAAGCHRLTVHAESPIHLHRSIQLIKSTGMGAGVALNPATPPAAVDYVLDELDLVLVMSVNPGFGGQSYLPLATRKIAALRGTITARGLQTTIQVDGGINTETIAAAAGAGATVFVAGTAVFGAPDYRQAIVALRQRAEAARR